jgi:hypothetical protein
MLEADHECFDDHTAALRGRDGPRIRRLPRVAGVEHADAATAGGIHRLHDAAPTNSGQRGGHVVGCAHDTPPWARQAGRSPRGALQVLAGHGLGYGA